jgi:hypothetical protein
MMCVQLIPAVHLAGCADVWLLRLLPQFSQQGFNHLRWVALSKAALGVEQGHLDRVQPVGFVDVVQGSFESVRLVSCVE